MARKTRRPTEMTTEDVGLRVKPAMTYRAAIYARLSLEDGGRKDSDSIENQIHLVRQFVEGHPELELADVFADNGETGLKFDRPQFNAMMEAIKRGEINCIVVKDLSRFGRCYIETGNYIERIFPFLGVRFISVNDNYDNHDLSSNFDALAISLKSLINNIYAKDISKKISVALEAKQRKGEFLGAYAAYGYLRCSEDRSGLVVNEKIAPIVRDIFRWVLEGESFIGICRRLNEAAVPSPGRQLFIDGLVKHEKFSKSVWTYKTLKGILVNPVYLGYMSQGKKKSRLFQGLPQAHTNKSDWVNVPDMHEAIITKEVFEAVGRILDDKKAAYHTNKTRLDAIRTENIFLGLIKCGHCGNRLTRRIKILVKGTSYYFTCKRYLESKDFGCAGAKHLREDRLVEAVWASIRAQIDLSADVTRLIQRARNSTDIKGELCLIDEQVNDTRKRIEQVDSLLKEIYGSYADGNLSEAEYLEAKACYANEKMELEVLIEGLLDDRSRRDIGFVKGNPWISNLDNFKAHENLSRDMLLALIDRIEVTHDRSINIVFKYRDEFETLLNYLADIREVANHA